jgi:superoxide dismutase, Fe-Mn family|tara:strand:+ start:4486 stop:5079 length:594 start_codon:yes stop_codon:yes gene_type:complete
MAFSLPKLLYSYNDLEPYIDAKTMEIHHSKHHNAYITNLNNAISGTSIENLSIEDICKNHSENMPIRNNGGGHYNHSLFWNILSPEGGGNPNDKIAELINSSFGCYDNFKEKFTNAAMTRFGSGWAWLCKVDNHVEICSTPNQDNPLMPGICKDDSIPLLGLDVWEHAYYLNYQNRRPDYVSAFFNLINWKEVNNKI